MSINIYDCGTTAFAYNTTTGRICNASYIDTQYENEQKVIDPQQINSVEQDRGPLQFKGNIKFSEETIHWQEQYTFRKQQSILNLITSQYKDAGITDSIPKNFTDLTETDKAFDTLCQSGSSELVGLLVGMGTIREGGDMFLTSLHTAFQQEAFNNGFSDEAIKKKIEELNLSNDVDKEFLLSSVKAYGTNNKIKYLDNGLKVQIEHCKWLDAATIYKAFVPEYANDAKANDKINDLSNSIEKAILEGIDNATKSIRQGYTGNILEKIKADSSFRLNVDGKSYTWNEVVDKLKQSGAYIPNSSYQRPTLGQCQVASSKYENHFQFAL